MKKYSRVIALLLSVVLILPGAGLVTKAEETTNVVRLAGKGRIETAVEVSKEAYKTGADAVVLAGHVAEADSLTGTLLAGVKNAPLLLTRKGELTTETAAEIARLKAKTVYILGGEAAVSANVEEALEALELTVVRVAGDNRYLTAAAVAEEVQKTEEFTHAFVVRGLDTREGASLADALAVGPVSATKKDPVLLVNQDELRAETKQAITDLGVTHVTIVGGTSAVSADVEAELEAMTGVTVKPRVFGDGRDETALAIAEEYFPTATTAVIANRVISADALVGGYFAAMHNAPILLTAATTPSADTLAFLEENTTEAFVLGGETVVTAAVFTKIADAVGFTEDLKVVSVSAINGLELQVTFSKPVDKTDLVDKVTLDNNPLNAPTADSLSEDGKVLTLTPVSGVIEADNDTLTVLPIKSADDEDVLSEKYVALFSYEDTVAPFVVKNEGKNKSAVITFNEDISGSSDFGVSLDGVNITTDNTKDIYYVLSGKTITINGLENGKTYKVEIVGAEDAAANVANPINLTVAPVAPGVRVDQNATITASGNKVTLVFAKEVNSETVTFAPAGGFAAGTVTLDKAVKTGVEYSKDNKTVTLDTQALGVLDGVSFLNTKVTVKAGDFAYNPAGKQEVSKDVRLTADKVAPKLVSSVAKNTTTGGKTLQLNFDKAVEVPTTNTIDLEITHIDGVRQASPIGVNGMTVTRANDGATTPKNIPTALVVDLETGTFDASPLADEFTAEKSYTVKVAANKVEDVYGNGVAEFSTTFTVPKETTAVEDPKAIITVVETYPQVAGNKITLKFSAPLTNVSAANFTLAGKALPTGTVVEFVTDKTQVEITLPAGSIVTSGNYVLTIANVADAAGNTLKAGAEKQTVVLTENVLPTITKAELVSNKTLKVTFSEPVSVAADKVKVFVGADEEAITYDAIPVNSEAKELTITITDALDADDLAKAITVKVLEDGVTDANGNVMVKDTVVAVVK